uniref:Uncharacterized protein n=1 Tax=Setaria italica TaxID=4555 RepID=K3YFL5_SETIT
MKGQEVKLKNAHCRLDKVEKDLEKQSKMRRDFAVGLAEAMTTIWS